MQEASVRKQIMLTPSLHAAGLELAESRGLSFAALVRLLIAAEKKREDASQRQPEAPA